MQQRRKGLSLVGLVIGPLLAFLVACAGQPPSPPAPSAAAPGASQPQYKFVYYQPAPLKNHFAGDRAVIDYIEKNSGGRIKIEYVSGGGMGKPEEQLKALQSGLFDIGPVWLSWHNAELPLANVLNLIWTGRHVETYQDPFKELIRAYPQIPAEFRGQGVEMLGTWAGAPNILFSKKPVNRLSGLKGMKIRELGMSAEALAAVGAVTTPITFGEIYTALERGVIEGAVMWPESVVAMKFHEVATHIFDPQFGSTSNGAISMNLAKFNSLPKDLQDVVISGAELWDKGAWEYITNVDRPDLLALGRQGKVKYVEVPQSEIDEWVKSVRPKLASEWAKGRSHNGADADQVVKKWIELRQQAEEKLQKTYYKLPREEQDLKN